MGGQCVIWISVFKRVVCFRRFNVPVYCAVTFLTEDVGLKDEAD